MVYGTETWTIGKTEKILLCKTEMGMLLWVQDVSIREHKQNWEIREAGSIIPMDTYLTRRRLQWYGHMRGRGEKEPMQQVYEGKDQEENEGQGNHTEGYKIEWNGGQECTESGEVAKSNLTGYGLLRSVIHLNRDHTCPICDFLKTVCVLCSCRPVDGRDKASYG